MFDALTRSNSSIMDFRKPFDPTNLPALKRYETGYSLFLVVDIPNCLAKLTEVETGEVTKIPYKSKYKNLITNYVQTLEKEFTGLQGLENITSETVDYEGKNEVSVSVINKTSEGLNPTITISYTEPYGATLTKVHELFLRGIDDTIIGRRKHYNGLIDDKILAPSFENEVFTFLYIITDNTGLNLEKAYMLFNAQPTTAALGELYNSEHGENEHKEVTCEFKCTAVTNEVVNAKAREILSALTGVKYSYDSSTGKQSVERVSKAIVIHDSNIPSNTVENTTGNGPYNSKGMDYDYVAPKAFTGHNLGLGTMTNEANEKLTALYRQLNQPYLTVNESEYDVDGISSGNNVNSNFSGDASESTNPATNIGIDSPCLTYNQEVFVVKGADGVNAYDDMGSAKVSATTVLASTTKGVVKGYVSRSIAQAYANKNQIRVIYGNSKLHPYRIELENGEDWRFSIQDIYILENGKLVNPRNHKEYDSDKYGLTTTDSPKFKKGDWVFVKPGARFWDQYYEKSNQAETNPQLDLAIAEAYLLTKISYVVSPTIATAIIKDGGSSAVYGTYAVYGVSSKTSKQPTLYIKQKDLVAVNSLNNIAANAMNLTIVDKLYKEFESKSIKNVTSAEELLQVIQSGGVLPSISDMVAKKWVTDRV